MKSCDNANSTAYHPWLYGKIGKKLKGKKLDYQKKYRGQTEGLAKLYACNLCSTSRIVSTSLLLSKFGLPFIVGGGSKSIY